MLGVPGNNSKEWIPKKACLVVMPRQRQLESTTNWFVSDVLVCGIVAGAGTVLKS
jgi:hypothetical protein